MEEMWEGAVHSGLTNGYAWHMSKMYMKSHYTLTKTSKPTKNKTR